VDVCGLTGRCEHRLSTGCLIDGACVPEGATDPADECRVCIPADTDDAYSPKPLSSDCGGSCSDSLDCPTGYFCSDAGCRPERGVGDRCDDDSECSSDRCEENSCVLVEQSGCGCATGGSEMFLAAVGLLGGFAWRRRER